MVYIWSRENRVVCGVTGVRASPYHPPVYLHPHTQRSPPLHNMFASFCVIVSSQQQANIMISSLKMLSVAAPGSLSWTACQEHTNEDRNTNSPFWFPSSSLIIYKRFIFVTGRSRVNLLKVLKLGRGMAANVCSLDYTRLKLCSLLVYFYCHSTSLVL